MKSRRLGTIHKIGAIYDTQTVETNKVYDSTNNRKLLGTSLEKVRITKNPVIKCYFFFVCRKNLKR